MTLIIIVASLAVIGLLNWKLHRPCIDCAKPMCPYDEHGFGHSQNQCERDYCQCRGGWKKLWRQLTVFPPNSQAGGK